MIHINLLPQDLRQKEMTPTTVRWEPFAILFAVLFLLLTVFFYSDYLDVRAVHKTIRDEWKTKSAVIPQLKQLEKRVGVELTDEKMFLEKNILNTESATRLFSHVSEYLPERGWLTEFRFDRDINKSFLSLKGIVQSQKNKSEIEQLEIFLQKLKKNLHGDTKTSLTTSKRMSGNLNETEFNAKFEWGGADK